jgi:hypothetical protein
LETTKATLLMMMIYYDYEQDLGVTYFYHNDSGELIKGYEQNLYVFYAWADLEFATAKRVKITDKNYKHLLASGLITAL